MAASVLLLLLLLPVAATPHRAVALGNLGS
jgi:hypothetical protein